MHCSVSSSNLSVLHNIVRNTMCRSLHAGMQACMYSGAAELRCSKAHQLQSDGPSEHCSMQWLGSMFFCQRKVTRWQKVAVFT